jgi:hypothetical protein
MIKRTKVVAEHLANVREAFDYFTRLKEEREEQYENKSERWQESEKGEEFSNDSSTLEEACNELETAADSLENLFEEL